LAVINQALPGCGVGVGALVSVGMGCATDGDVCGSAVVAAGRLVAGEQAASSKPASKTTMGKARRIETGRIGFFMFRNFNREKLALGILKSVYGNLRGVSRDVA
jgi:hypothetical protein